jgi:predicted 2-oxoglutarate/Fe(II)-dependent dioxygenase YbiX|tara:strand:- start:1494 stop:2075 length:582 start_codon:yes stop_codon:yes gene_type:complete
MDVKDLIYIKDDLIPYSALSSLIKWINTQSDQFVQAKVVESQNEENVVDESIRKVENFTLRQFDKSQTEIHWVNFFIRNFYDQIHAYQNKFKTNCAVDGILEITILKYKNSGHYSYHCDHCKQHPRTLSLIYLLNNEYEGGDLVFGSVDKQDEIFRVEKKPNRLIIWPSNFVYPHKVEPVKKGTRYSIVSWAL